MATRDGDTPITNDFVVELKIWRSDKYEKKGRDQLSEYLATRGKDEEPFVSNGTENGFSRWYYDAKR